MACAKPCQRLADGMCPCQRLADGMGWWPVPCMFLACAIPIAWQGHTSQNFGIFSAELWLTWNLAGSLEMAQWAILTVSPWSKAFLGHSRSFWWVFGHFSVLWKIENIEKNNFKISVMLGFIPNDSKCFLQLKYEFICWQWSSFLSNKLVYFNTVNCLLIWWLVLTF